jgi:hypothetical protein
VVFSALVFSPSSKGIMVLSKAELISSLQNEVRILIHLATKIDASMLDYRPTPKQRSTFELLKYLSMMGTLMIQYGLDTKGEFDRDKWMAASQAAEKRDFNQTVEAIAAQGDAMAALLADVTDAEFRSEMSAFDGSKLTRGVYLVNSVLGGFAAYRMQLFLYLKACGREELGTTNLWGGADAPAEN